MFEPFRAMVLFNPIPDLLATQLGLNPIHFGVISRIQVGI
jgi:hypothetical protein